MHVDPEAVRNSPLWHIHEYDRGEDSVTLLRIEETLYRNASFLDQRVEAEADQKVLFHLRQLEHWFPNQSPAPTLNPNPPGFIFHIGHCGSTLLSRALASTPNVLPVREPLTLRYLARDLRSLRKDAETSEFLEWQALLLRILAALGRRFHPGQLPLVKATSTCNNLLGPIMRAVPEARAILMFLRLEPFLAGMLGKQSPALDLHGHAATRLHDWAEWDGAPPLDPERMNEAQLAALAWLTGMQALLEAARRFDDHLRLLDFEEFLVNPETELSRAAEFFGIESELPRILDAWPLVSTGYSKQPDHPYSAFSRRRILERGRTLRGHEIRSGLQWARALITDVPALGGCSDLLR